MKRLFTIIDDYIKELNWKDFALIKFCLCSMGMLVGLSIPKRSRKPIGVLALLIFVGTYVPLMIKFFSTIKSSFVEQTIELD